MGTKRFQDHTKFGDDVNAQIFANAKDVLESALRGAELLSEHLGFDKTGGLTIPQIRAKLDILHQRISRDGWIETSEKESFLSYIINRDTYGKLMKEHTNRLEQLQWDISALVAGQQRERQRTEGFSTFCSEPRTENYHPAKRIATEDYDLPMPTTSTKPGMEDNNSLQPDDYMVRTRKS